MQRQGGASLSGWLIGLIILVFLLSVAIKFVPHYLDFNAIKWAMDELKTDPGSHGGGKRETLARIGNKLRINDVEAVTERDFMFKRATGGYELSVEYEAREHLFGNLDAVLTFSHQVEIAVQ